MPVNPRFVLATAACSALLTSAASGAGFAIAESSVSGLGTGYAGASATATDASTIYFNPAGMTYLDAPTVTTGIHLLIPKADFTDDGSLSAYNPVTQGGVPTSGGASDGAETAFIPNLYFVQPVNDTWAWGIGLNAPFGLSTDYGDNWVGRYVAIESSLTTINAELSLAAKVNDRLSVGAGISLLYADVVLSNAIDFGAAAVGAGVPGFTPAAVNNFDGKAELEGDDIGVGFNAGLIYEATDWLRLGINYRSEVALDIEGRADFTVPAALDPVFSPTFFDQDVGGTLDLPADLSVSAVITASPKWTILGDITWTDWSAFEDLDFNYADPATEAAAGRPIPEKWKDVLRFSVGTEYALNDAWTLRAGWVYDQSPVPGNRFRSPRIPDEDRNWLAIGFAYAVNESLVIDAGYVHVFVDDPMIKNDTHTDGQFLQGKIEASVDLFSLGASWRF